MGDPDRNQVFCDRVRAAYIELYGSDGLEDPDDPFSLGTCVVAFEVDHVDGEHSSLVVYDGSQLTAMGLVWRALEHWRAD